MGFRFHRSIKILPGIRLNFGKRGISTSIGVRGAHVTFGKTGTRTTVGLPGSGLSYTHLERPHRETPVATAAAPPHNPAASPGSALRGLFWLGLIVVAIVAAIGQRTSPTTPAQQPTPAPTLPQTTAQAAAQTADEKRLAEVNRAALGVAQIRHAVAHPSTFKLSRVTVMPTGTICYQFRLNNSRGVAYARTAVMDGTVLKSSGSDAFTALWNSRCAHQSGGHDITSEVENVVHRSAN